MPVSRYISWVGGVLLALLFVANACVPDRPGMRSGNGHSATIRIYSDRKLPDRIVFDTSQPTIAPTGIANAEAAAPLAVESPQTRAREAFAQLRPSAAERVRSRQPTHAEVKPQPQTKIARRPTERPVRLVARRSQYGWFGYQVW
jgi:hypothetical protein